MNHFRTLLTMAVMLVGASVAGCAEENTSQVRSYVDSAGRSCTVDIEAINGVATCDVSPASVVTCGSGTEPVFSLNDDVDFETRIWTLESCGGCIDYAAHTTYIDGPSCANLTCETDEDCVKLNYMCEGGICLFHNDI